MTSDSQPLIFDILVELISYVDEKEYQPLRLVNSEWNEAVGLSLSKGQGKAIPELIRQRRFMSAMNIILRNSDKIYPNRIIIAASEIPHTGIIRYILNKYPGLKGGPCIDNLLTGEITHANLLSLVEFYKYGRRDRRINIEFAAKHNCIELAEVIDINEHISNFGINNAFNHAVKHNNPRMVQIIVKSKYFQKRTEEQILVLINKNVEIALICVESMTHRLAYEFYEKLSAIGDDKYTNIMTSLQSLHDEHIEIERQRSIREKALDDTFFKIKKSIVRSLAKKFPLIKVMDVHIEWEITKKDVLKVDWNKPWGYQYQTNSQSVGAPTRIYVYSLYNVGEVSNDMARAAKPIDNPCKVQ